MTLFLAGLTLGFFSLGHCLGMCGPLAFALGASQVSEGTSRFHRIHLFAIVGLGKAITYAWLGFCFGWLGHFVSEWSAWLGLSKIMPWVAGSLFAFIGLGIAGMIPKMEIVLHRVEMKMQQIFGPLIKKKQGVSHLLLLGLLWGLLPCPMVLAPALGAAVSGSVSGAEGALRGFFMMFAFGIGTIPALYIGAFAGDWFMKLRRWSPLIVGYGFVVVGILTVVYSVFMMGGNYAHHHH